MASSSTIHASPTSSSRSFKYDVFLSFRGLDTRNTFVDHLYSSLEEHQITTYKDDVSLPQGESISPSLLEAIQESHIALIIFSKNYANSCWCLDELSHIMKCKKERDLIVIPIFYDVDPSEVRKQKRDFKAGFAQLEEENINKAQLMRNAFVEAGNISGWEAKIFANRHESKIIKEILDANNITGLEREIVVDRPESKVIKEIVETVFDKLCLLNINVDEESVGMASRLLELKSLLNIGLESVLMVGIWGIGGSGKTTLATAFYEEVSKHFQGVCIIENVREETNRCGLKKLQEDILLSLFKKVVYVQSIKEGKGMIKRMACRRKVLLVLDDVSSLEQLESLAGKHDWFGSGSRIIITTRDEHLLRAHKVDEICKVRLLTNVEAIRLFNRHAYNEKDPIEDYNRLSLNVVSYAAGLPLALKVLGSFLYDKRKSEWMSALDRLKDIPEMEIVEKLKISYDGLKNVEQELFLYLSCFFRGYWKESIMHELEACDYYPQIGIEVLRQKALVTVKHGVLDMHDLIQEMGHYIVRGNHSKNPEKHTRVWKEVEIENMCYSDATTENDMIEAIRYRNCESHFELEQHFFNFISNTKKLRYLNVELLGHANVKGFVFLSNELRYLKWKGYPRSPFPDAFQPMNLVSLTLHRSMQDHLWKRCKLPSLKVLELEKMEFLESTPDFHELPCLQDLRINFCNVLAEIHQSLGDHIRLEKVHIWHCPKLEKFPTIVNMKKLKTLEIRFCGKILEFPEIQANMESLESLTLFGTSIQVLPSSIEKRCTNLSSICLACLSNLKSIQFNFERFQHLRRLQLEELPDFKDEIPYSIGIGMLSNLQHLCLCSCWFSRLDFSLAQHNQLKLLDMSCCESLIELPELPSSLNILLLDGCQSLVTLGDCYKNCARLSDVSVKGGSIISDGDKLLDHMLKACMAIENQSMLLQLEGAEVAKGFTPCLHEGGRCGFELPEDWCNDFSGFLICILFKTNYSHGGPWIDIKDTMMRGESEDDVIREESGKSDGDSEEEGDGDGDGDSEEESDGDGEEESDGDGDMDTEDDLSHVTCVVYVPFASLKETTWWNSTHKSLQFSVDDYEDKDEKILCSGLQVRLIERRRRTGSNETHINSSDHHTPELRIQVDTEFSLSFFLEPSK